MVGDPDWFAEEPKRKIVVSDEPTLFLHVDGKSMFRIFSLVTAFFVGLMGAVPVLAQSEGPEGTQATVVFDIDVKSVLQNPLFNLSGMKDALYSEGMIPPKEFLDVDRLKRIHGGVQLPESMRKVMEMRGDSDLPFNFFLQLEFDDKKEMKRFHDEIAKDFETVQKEGKSYLCPPENNGPQNFLIHQLNKTTLEFGTEMYLTRSNRDVVTRRLKRVWSELDKQADVRVGVDLKSSRKFVDEFGKMAASEGGMSGEESIIFEEVTAFLKHVETSCLSLSFDSDNMLNLIIRSDSEDGAREVEDSISGMLYVARIAARVGIRSLPFDDEKINTTLRALTDQLKTKRDAKRIAVVVNRPAGFDKSLERLIVEAKKTAEQVNKMNRFRQVGIAIHNYADSYRKFPFQAIGTQNENLSWRVRVLPFCDENNLFDVMDVKQAWDDEVNKPLVNKMPELFGPGGKRSSICWIKGDANQFEAIRDGTSNTIMFMENPNGVPWSQNQDLEIEDAIKLVKSLKDGQKLIIVMYDCSVRQIDNRSDEKVLRAMMTPNGKEIIPWHRQPGVDRRDRFRDKKAVPRGIRATEMKEVKPIELPKDKGREAAREAVREKKGG